MTHDYGQALLGLAFVAMVMAIGYGTVVQESSGTTILLTVRVAALLSGIGVVSGGYSDTAPSSARNGRPR